MKFQKTEHQRGDVTAGHDSPSEYLVSRRLLIYSSAAMAFTHRGNLASMLAMIAPVAAEAGGFVRLRDLQGFTKGPFTAFMTPYNKGPLLAGIDFSERFTLDPARFPTGSVISWSWPRAKARAPIRGFLAIDYGDYYNTKPETPIPSSKVRDIKALRLQLRLSISGTRSGFNTIVNFFLTSTTNPNTILFEIEVFLHTPNYAKTYIDRCPAIGTFTSTSGVAWKVCKDPFAVNGPDILFYPTDQEDMLVGEIDLRDMLLWIKSRNVITGHEYFNGLAVGIEPQQRAGSVTVNALAVKYLT